MGQPKPRSWFWVVLSVVVAALAGVSIFRIVLSDGSDEQLFSQLGVLFVGLWSLSDVGGALLYVRRGAAWGRTLRVFGYAVFFPLAILLHLAGSWFTSRPLFVVQVGFLLLVALVIGAPAIVRRARRNGTPRRDG